MKPHRVQRQRTKGWKMPKNTISVGRPSKWGNPFHLGSNRVMQMPRRCRTQKSLVTAYRWYLRMWMSNVYGTFLGHEELGTKTEFFKELRGKDLACWCRLDQPCHADVLLELANQSQ